jgi:hypothetical protein
MPINPSLLVSAAMLQDYLVDNATGLPLSDGTITLYKDNSRTTFKNWYYLTGAPGSYTFTTLPNPMTLSAVGTITDGNGNDVIPFYYPYDENDSSISELYYIVVTNSNGQQQFTRQDFPFGAFSNNTPVNTTGTALKNYIVNNVFWRNVGSVTDANLASNPLSGFKEVSLAPSAHDGLSMPDWRYISDVTGGTDTLTFTKFPAGTTLGASNQDVTPEYYLNFTCTGAGTATYKNVQVPLSLHLKTLELVPAVLVIWARCNSSGGTGGNQITLTNLQYTGTGTTSPMTTPVDSFMVPVSSNFTKLVTNSFVFPTSSGLSIGSGADDAWYLQIGFSASETFSIDIAKVQLFIGSTISNNETELYDDVDAVINDFRTGDVRSSLNAFSPFGWVPMNDGIISNGAVGMTPAPTPPSGINTARQNIDTWSLYSLIWTNVNPTFAPIYDNTGAGTTRGASAIADWSAGKQLQLTLALGRTFLGLPPATTFTYVNGTGIFTVAANALFDVGSPVYMTNSGGAIPSGFALNTIYYAIPIAGSTTTLQVATSYANAIAGTAFIPASDNGSGTNSFNFALGGAFGEKQHTQLTTELATHNHAMEIQGAGATIHILNANATTATSGLDSGIIVNNGSSAPFNIVQPSTYMNIFIKL